MKLKYLIDAFGLLLISAYFLHFIPVSALEADPATGGDTGSHFWPLVTLFNNSLPEFSFRAWNPGNLAGEPQLVHYFPLPYLIMAFLGLFMPLATAFNIGTLLPLLLLPSSVYLCFYLMRLRFPAPILAASFSLFFIYNESYTMWGGNTLSTMAGQFAHGYGLIFLFPALGFLSREILQRSFPWKSSLMFAAVCLSHAYVMVGIPLFLLGYLLLHSAVPFYCRAKTIFISGAFGILLSAWFLIPMLDNSDWTIPHSFKWSYTNFSDEVLPPIFYPALLIIAARLIFVRAARYTRIENQLMFWLLPMAGYMGYYFLFPVNVRAIPQLMLFACIFAGLSLPELSEQIIKAFSAIANSLRAISFSGFVKKFSITAAGRFFRLVLDKTGHKTIIAVSIIISSVCWADFNINKFPGWANWNYSGWKSKSAYTDLSKLYGHLRADLSAPRVVFEHSSLNNRAGTTRVFEMLPYFANRATLESVYLQASILAPAAFLIQSEVSKEQSCPFNGFSCKTMNIGQSIERLKLLGVGQLILITEEAIKQANSSPDLEFEASYDIWNVYRLKQQPALAEVFSVTPISVSDNYWEDWLKENVPDFHPSLRKMLWKNFFYDWLKMFKTDLPMIVLDNHDSDWFTAKIRDLGTDSTARCNPKITAGINRLQLKTDCPGKAHFIKFSYHPGWQADTGDKLFLVSPGFIALIPSKNEVNFEFGGSFLWRAAGFVSVFSAIICFVIALLSNRVKAPKKPL